MRMRYLAALFTTTLLLLGLSIGAQAQTPDGETPAEEVICDPLKADGITKGLYGLCIAFCEAQDIVKTEEFDPLALDEKQAPASRLLAAYERKRGANDPEMPCLVKVSKCPLFNMAACLEAKAAYHDPDKIFCKLDVVNVAEAFSLHDDCSRTDLCRDGPDGMRLDYCESAEGGVTDSMLVNLYSGQGARSNLDGVGYWNGRIDRTFWLDAETAALCAAELDAYDGTVPPADGSWRWTEPCFLAP